MDEDDVLQVLPMSEVDHLLECLKPHYPASIHAYQFIISLKNWKEKMPEIDINILTPGKGCKSGAVFFYVQTLDYIVCSLYTWTESGKSALRNALLTTKRINWNEPTYFIITCMNPEMWSFVEPLVPTLLKDRPAKPIISHDKVFWLPKEEALKLDVRVPENMRLGELEAKHIDTVNDNWPYKTVGTDKLIEMMLKVNFGRGLFKSDGQLVAWAFYWFFGALGVLHTVENERRHGYGKVVVHAVSKEMASAGLDVNLNIVNGNTVSEAFFRSLGFQLAFSSVWLTSASPK